ncbi:hypothetical protein CsatA_016341 [Cannabis sativa]
MAKTKNAQPSKKPSRGSASASPITPPAPPAPATGAPGSSSAPTKSARKSKTQARKSSSSSNGAPNVDKAMVTLPTENPPSVSSSDSEPEEETEEDHESEGLSDSSEEFVPKDQPVVDDSASESEEPEADPVTTEPIPVPAAYLSEDTGIPLL